MELAEVTLTPIQRRNRAAFLKHAELARQQAEIGREPHSLCQGEEVVLHADDGAYFSGRVIESLVTQGEHTYLISVGVRLPEQWALLRAGQEVVAQSSGDVEEEEQTQELLDLLGAIRVSYGGLPKQAGSRRVRGR